MTADGPSINTLSCADCEGIRTELALMRDARNGAHLFSQTDAGLIEAVPLPGICRDTMAESAYGYRAEVILGNATARRTFSGCAYLGAGTAPP